MGFNTAKFETAKLRHRQFGVKVPVLKDFFENSDPVWFVRGLSGEEVARVNEAIKLNANLAELIEGLVSDSAKEKIDAIKESLGITTEVPHETVRRIALLVHGSVDPVCSQSVAVKIARDFSAQFYELTTKILELTGMGSELGE